MKHVFVMLYFLALTIIYSFPLILHFDSHLPYGYEGPTDALFSIWSISANVNNMREGKFNSSDGNIFYPEVAPLSLNDRSLFNSIIALALMHFTQNMASVFNSLFFIISVFSGWGMFLLCYRITGSFIPSLVASTAVDFYGFYYYPQNLYANSWEWLFFSIYFLSQYFESKRLYSLLLSGIFYIFTCISSLYIGVMLTYLIAGFLIYHIYNFHLYLKGRFILNLICVFILSGLAILLLWHPYIELSKGSGFVQPLIERAGFSYRFLSFFSIKKETGLLWWNITGGVLEYLGEWESFFGFTLTFFTLYYLRKRFGGILRTGEARFSGLFTGLDRICILMFYVTLICIFLDAAGIYPIVQSGYNRNLFNYILTAIFYYFFFKVLFTGEGRKKFINCMSNIPVVERFFIYVLLLTFLLSLGPFGGPYLLFEKLLPGLSAMRAPHRIFRIGLISAGLLSAIGARDFLKNRKNTRLASTLLMLFAMVEYFNYPLKLYQLPTGDNIPDVYKWLAEKKEDIVVLELPIQKPLNVQQTAEEKQYQNLIATRYMYFSIFHRKKLVNGYSSFIPGRYDKMLKLLQYFPDIRTVETLKELGVRYIILHTESYTTGEVERIKDGLAEKAIFPVADLSDALVFELN